MQIQIALQNIKEGIENHSYKDLDCVYLMENFV